MTDYISREAALEITTRTCGDYAAAFAEIRKLPAAGVAPVVRCKECAYARPTVRCSDGKQAGIWCSYHDIVPVDADGFCSNGIAR